MKYSKFALIIIASLSLTTCTNLSKLNEDIELQELEVQKIHYSSHELVQPKDEPSAILNQIEIDEENSGQKKENTK